MLEDINRLVVCGDEESGKLVEEIAAKFNCSPEKVYWTVRSVYGRKLRELRFDAREPSRHDLLQKVFVSKDSKELFSHYPKMSIAQQKGIFDRVLGVSTFHKAKELSLLEMLPKASVPQTDNNEAMWAACRLGDGHYDPRRNSWKIEHCARQRGWLERKVELFCKAFPQASSKITHNEKKNTYSWYSCRVGSGKFREIGVAAKHTLVDKLNEFGVWWLFLDDGSYEHNRQQRVSFAVENMEVATRLVEFLNKRGFDFRVNNKHLIVLTGMERVVQFHKRFLEPFENLTPDCMKYKTTYAKI